MELKEFYQKLGKRIKYLRKLQGLTQEQLAEKAGISADFLGKIEVNIDNPGIKSIVRIINALNITVEDFFKTIK